MIDWLEPACKEWGAQTRRLWIGGVIDGNTGIYYPDGWKSQSSINQFNDGAGQSTQILTQFPEESYLGEALIVWRAIRGYPHLPFPQYTTFWTHYAVRAKTRVKVDLLRMTVPEYWRNLDRAHYFLAGRIPHNHAEVTI